MREIPVSGLQPDGYKKLIDQAGMNTPVNLLIPFLRFPNDEVVDEKVHDQVKLASDYAIEHNLALVADIDVRSARRAFKNAYPDELQEMLRLKEVILPANSTVDAVVPSIDLNDHYSGEDITHHIPLKGKLLRVFSYHSSPEGIEQESIKDVTSECSLVSSSKDSVKVKIPAGKKGQPHACVHVSFIHLYPEILTIPF